MNETSSGITTNLYNGFTYTDPYNTTITATASNLDTLIINQSNMVKQVKVAVFTVERNDKNEVISSKFIKELWVEQKNSSSIELAVSKFLEPDFDPETIVIKILYNALF
jgi:hypothetical protein